MNETYLETVEILAEGPCFKEHENEIIIKVNNDIAILKKPENIYVSGEELPSPLYFNDITSFNLRKEYTSKKIKKIKIQKNIQNNSKHTKLDKCNIDCKTEEELINSFNKLEISDSKISEFIPFESKIIKIQKWFRGCILRLKQMPLIMYKIKKYLKTQTFKLSNQNEDGRINSCDDEDVIIKLIIEKFGNKIKKPKIRMWYDILVFDYIYGWIPVNIKTTTTLTSDNTGNLAMCVYAYTDETLDIRDKSYENGKMSDILFDKLKNKKYNINNKKDYYFIVLNKRNTKDIIINSVKGLTSLTPNINNLPFQVCWDKNRIFKYENINKKIKLFIDCLQKPKPSWKENFMYNIRTLK